MKFPPRGGGGGRGGGRGGFGGGRGGGRGGFGGGRGRDLGPPERVMGKKFIWNKKEGVRVNRAVGF